MQQAAMQWWLQVRDAPADASVQRAFDAWLAADDRHRLAYLDVLMALNAAAESTQPARAPQTAGWMRRHAGWVGAAFASLAFCAVLLGPRWSEQWRADAVAPPGSERELVLDDGTRLVLGADSAIAYAVDADRRDITLLRGTVTVAVAVDPRPLTLHWRDAEVRDIGTRFTVQAAADVLRVGVEEGRVDVRRGGAAPVSIGAGERVDWDDASPTRGVWHAVVATPDLLLLDQAPAALAVAQWAAHRGTRVVWIGSPPSGLPLDAALPMRTRDDQQAALATLARHYRFDVVLDGGGVLVLRSSR